MRKLKKCSIIICLVMVCNLFMVAFSAPFNLVTPPQVIKNLQDITVNIGDPVRLECIVTGNPKPICKIYFEGKPLSSNENVTIANKGNIYTLTIESATEDDSGVYTFVFTNPAGETRTSAKVLVE